MINPISFLLLTISLVFSGFSLFNQDVLRIENPLFTQEFGFFKTCLYSQVSSSSSKITIESMLFPFNYSSSPAVATSTSAPTFTLRSLTSLGNLKKVNFLGKFEYCTDFPRECSLKKPSHDGNGNVSLSFCQSWLVARYLKISAFVLGLLAWALFLLSTQLTFLMPFLFLLTVLFGVLEVMTAQVVTQLRDDPLFSLGGSFGSAYTAINGSWGIASLALVTLAVSFLMQSQQRRTVFFVYTPIPT